MSETSPRIILEREFPSYPHSVKVLELFCQKHYRHVFQNVERWNALCREVVRYGDKFWMIFNIQMERVERGERTAEGLLEEFFPGIRPQLSAENEGFLASVLSRIANAWLRVRALRGR
jgi:hypothetical protein